MKIISLIIFYATYITKQYKFNLFIKYNFGVIIFGGILRSFGSLKMMLSLDDVVGGHSER